MASSDTTDAPAAEDGHTGLFSSIYLASKILAAVMNVGAVVLFVRLGGEALYGDYLIAFAFGFIAFSFAGQWLINAHFGRQSGATAGPVGVAMLVTLVLTLPVAALLLAGAVLLDLLEPRFAAPALAFAVGLSLYFAGEELARSRLAVGAVVLGGFLRSALTLVLGGGALWLWGRADGILYAIAVSHSVGAIPGLLAWARRARPAWPPREQLIEDMLGLARYGAPLILAGGATALALSVDRIVLDRFLGAASVGAYGAVLDFTKQSFVLVGDAVTISYIAMAKSLFGEGKRGDAREVLLKSSATIVLLSVFGAVFFLLAGPFLFEVMFGLSAEQLEGMRMAVLVLTLGNVFLLLRAYYFAQSIYFTASAKLELAATLLSFVVGLVLCLWLIPVYGLTGAAIGYAAGQVAALGVFLTDRATRETMPVAWDRTGAATAVGAGLAALGLALDAALPTTVAALLNIALLGIGGLVFAWVWDVFDARTIAGRLTGGRLA